MKIGYWIWRISNQKVKILTLDDYCNEIPDIPPEETFQEVHWSDDRFEKSDTIHEDAQIDLGEDKRAV